MTEFTDETLRCYCRNPRCRSKLPTAVSNAREAFCTRGCYSSFYLHHCVACEGPIARKRDDQKVCRKAKCRNAWRAGSCFGRYATSDAKLASKTPDFIDPKTPPKPDRAWHIVAGPELSRSALHCATVPDGKDRQWNGGEYERIEAKNRAALRAHFAKLAKHCLIPPHHPPVNVLGGYRFPGAPVVDLAPITRSFLPRANDNAVSHDGSLDIPAFLRRTSLKAPLRPAA